MSKKLISAERVDIKPISLEQYSRTVIAQDFENREQRKLTRADQVVIELCEKWKMERCM